MDRYILTFILIKKNSITKLCNVINLVLGAFITRIFCGRLKPPLNIVLVRWYDEIDEIYGCPRLQLTNQYTCIYLDSVDMSVHIIPRNNCKNEYFVNRYVF